MLNNTKAELKLKVLTYRKDLDMMDKVVRSLNGEEIAGLENINQDIIKTIASSIKDEYDEIIPESIAGLEGFVDKIKEFLKTAKEALKSKPDKNSLTKVKKFAWEAKKAADVYMSDKWLKEQVFINVGKATFQVPKALAEVNTPDGYKAIVDPAIKNILSLFDKNIKNAEARLNNGLKIFNKYSNKEWSKELEDALLKELPVKPEIAPKVKAEDIKGLLDFEMVKGELPVLTKEQVKEVGKLMISLSETFWKIDSDRLDLVGEALSMEDWWGDDFWEQTQESTNREMYNAVEWRYIDDHNLTTLLDESDILLVKLAQFLENWILYSVK